MCMNQINNNKKMSKSQEKTPTFFPKYFQQNRHFLKNTDF